MLNVILFVLGLFLASLVSSYLTWGPLTSPEMVDYFSPAIRTRKQLPQEDLYERKRKAGVSAEMLRAFLLTIFCLLVIPFYSTSIEVWQVINNPFFRWCFLIAFFMCFFWCVYAGPRFFAIRYCGEFKYFSRTHFRRFIRPYLAWLPYALFIFGGIGLLTLSMIVGGVAADAAALQSLSNEINTLQVDDVKHIQFAMIRLIGFGDFISEISQKYVLTTLLIFSYVIIEQRTSMKNTILDTSVERLKYFVWVALIFTLGFSLVILPNQYNAARIRIQDRVEEMTFISMTDHLTDVLSIQKSLEEHDLKWVFLNIVTGYGNLLTAAVVGIIVYLWRLFFVDVPVRYIIRLIIPRYILERMNRFGEGFSVDMDIKRD